MPSKNPPMPRPKKTPAAVGKPAPSLCVAASLMGLHLLLLRRASGRGSAQIGHRTQRLHVFHLKMAPAVEGRSIGPTAGGWRGSAIGGKAEEAVVKLLVLFLLWEVVGNRHAFAATCLFPGRHPLVLVHGVPCNQKGEHIFHARVIGHAIELAGQ